MEVKAEQEKAPRHRLRNGTLRARIWSEAVRRVRPQGRRQAPATGTPTSLPRTRRSSTPAIE